MRQVQFRKFLIAVTKAFGFTIQQELLMHANEAIE